MTNDIKLKACPFCNGEAEFSLGKTGDGSDWHYISCSDCEAMGPHVNYASHGIRLKETLGEAWNRRALLDRLEAPADRVETEWQPIESAPKNRKVLASYRNIMGNWRVITACYHTELPWSEDQDCDDDGEYAPEGWYEESDSSETIYPTAHLPTHWMPLPSPPGELSSAPSVAADRVEKLEAALRDLERRATAVANKGAVPGHHFVELSGALIKARAVLSERAQS
jgi:Lar family restriction alleviation protein